jgi:CPA2 family monovalent cation:H+ antiporter-2
MEFTLVENMVLLLLVALAVAFVLLRFNIPAVVGFLLSGAVIGPHGLGLISDIESVKSIAEVGIILLLFTIGIEFAPARLMRIGKEILLGGGLYLIITLMVIGFISSYLGLKLKSAIVIGFIFSLSSTAIVLKILYDRAETTTAYGKLTIGVLLFQDLAVIPAMIILNLSGDTKINMLLSGMLSFASLIGLFFLTYFTGRLILGYAARTMHRELFTIAVIVIGLGVPLLAHLSGASYSLGAFIAGLGLSRCEYSHQVETEILPFRDVFNSIFFISMGMLIDINFISRNVFPVLLLSAGLIILKIIIAMISLRFLQGSFRIIFLSAFALANAGEFSLVLLGISTEKNILTEQHYQILISIASLSMLFAPFLIMASHRIVFKIQEYFKELETRIDIEEELRNHVIICGYGVNGQNLAKVLKATGLKYLILEINPATVRSAKVKGEPIFYGDATRSEILVKAGVKHARMIVLAISDPVATRRAVWTARQLNKNIYILVRTRFVSEVEELYKLGANSVIPEEFETSIEIFARVLKEYRIPDNVIAQQIQIIRMKGYEMLRSPDVLSEKKSDIEKILLSTLTESIYIEDNSPATGNSIEKLNIRKETGASIIAVVREGKAITNPPGDLKIQKSDVVILIGSHAQLFKARKLLTGI